MSPQDNVLFLQVAVKKGYLNSQQAASIFSQNNNDSLLSFLKRNKILSSQQIRDIEAFLQHYYHDSTSRGITNNTSVPRPLQQKNIDRYQVLQELGRGGMGTVYKCWDPKLQRTIALKTLIHHGDTNSISRFLVEIRATIQLHHPNIIRIYEVGEENGVHFFTMDYLNGVSFHELIHEKKISLRKSIHMIIKIAKALDYAHNQGIIHRDLKPTNIMVDNNMEPFVVDFGLAKMVGQNNQITESGTVLGTPHYMAPEQATGNIRNIDMRTDIYALGVILYEAITGKLPFYSNNRVELMVKIVEKTPLLPSRSNKRISKQLDAICLKAMAKKKEERYCSANDFAEDLEKYMSGQPPQAFQESKQSKSKWPIILLTTVVFIVVSLFFYMQSSQPVAQITTSPTETTSNEKLDNLIKACFDGAELDLDKQQINDDELTYILQKIPQLTSLNLSRVKTIRGSSFEHLARFKDTLVRLDLKACSVENKYLVHLQKLNVLNRIDFEETNFDKSGLFHLKDMQQLQSLDLSGSKIASLIYIKNLHQLQRLELAETNINDDDLRHIVHLHKLHILSLESTNITNDALKYIVQLKSLETLYLKRTQIDNGAVVYFKKLPHLYELHLKGTKVTLDAMYKIQTFAPRCKIKY